MAPAQSGTIPVTINNCSPLPGSSAHYHNTFYSCFTTCGVAIDFSIHFDFVTGSSIYFAAMLPGIILTLCAILYRLLYVLAGSPVNWANFSPVAAIFLCSGAFLYRRAAYLWPLLALFVSDVIINAHYRVPLLDTRMLSGYFCFGLLLLLGRWLGRRQEESILDARRRNRGLSALLSYNQHGRLVLRLVGTASSRNLSENARRMAASINHRPL